MLVDLTACERLTGVRREQRQNLEFLCGEVDFLAAQIHLIAVEENLKVTRFARSLALRCLRVRQISFVATQMRLDAQQQFFGRERLHHVIVAAVFEANRLVDDVAFCGKEHDGDSASLFANGLAHVKAVHARHHHVEQQQVGVLGRQHFQSFFAAVCAAI